jgi:apolipoprotein N-acyltransferase
LNASFLRFIFFAVSFVFVAFGQNAWVGWLGPFSALMGYALFWRSILEWATPKQRFALGLVWFSSIQALQLSWMATTEYMGPLILVVYVLLCLALGVQFGFLTWLVGRWPSLSSPNSAALAGIWVLLEWMRLYLCTGFTWNPVGLALTTCPLSLQMASVFGIFGLSFWVIFVNLLALRASYLRSFPSIAACALFALVPYIYGAMQMAMVSFENRKLSTLLVQTALLPEQRDYDPHHPDRFVNPLDQWDRMIGLIEQAKSHQIDLIVFPEGAMPYEAFHCVYPVSEMQRIWASHFGSSSQQMDLPPLGLDDDEKALSRLVRYQGRPVWQASNAFWVQALANHYHCEVIAGMDDRDIETGKHFNAAFHFSPQSRTISRIEKRILVPIGEYVPFKKLSGFSQFVSQQFGIGDSFEPGKEAKVFSGRVPLGVSICYEETFSEMIRDLRQKNAQMFVNISNDVWFPRSRLAKQHFDHGMVRAVENGLPLVRACNTGVTCGVNCLGGILARHPENQPGVLFLEVPLHTFPTIYSKWGDWAILVLSAFFVLACEKKKRYLPEIKKVD